MTTRRRRLERACSFLCCCGAASGCNDATSDAGLENGCPEIRETSLDAKFGDASSGYETPREVIALLERPVTGTLTWLDNEENEYLDISGASGTTTFHAQATAGPTVWLRPGIVGMGGTPEARLFCGTDLIFDVTVHIETEDGALDEDWQGQGTYGFSGSIGIEIEDPPPFVGTLRVNERPAATAAWKDRRFNILLIVATYPLHFVGMAGTMHYVLWNEGDGEIVGVDNTIAELAWPADEDTTGG